MSILRKIIKAKKAEVKSKSEKMPVEKLLQEITKTPANRNFKDVIENNRFTIIGEIKKKSPSKGVIKASVNVAKQVKMYENAGIKALSIVTDKKFFDGSLDYIMEAKKHTSLPVLRKDFIIDEYQIYESRLARADAVLLIAGAVEKRVLYQLVKKTRSLGMTPIVEVATNEEARRAAASGVDIIGINTRDLKTFKINLQKVKSLVKAIPKDRMIICESGIMSVEDLEGIMIDERIKGVLVGTLLMKSNEKQIRDFTRAALNKYGRD
jgi:indole-3-glycerol phosphate synthase